MSLQGRGKAIIYNFECAHCGYKDHSMEMKANWSCVKCGARYSLVSHLVDANGEIDYEYDMVGFVCIQNDFMEKCDNQCPAPYMYCKVHSSEKHLERAKKSIDDAKRRVEDAKHKCKLVEESRKTWMITELSGIDNEQS